MLGSQCIPNIIVLYIQGSKHYMTLKNRTSRQENEENDMKIFKNQDMNITLEKGSVQDSCYDDTFLVSLLFDHKGLVCKNTAVGVDELTGRAFDPEA